jgi:hypothetical protein
MLGSRHVTSSRGVQLARCLVVLCALSFAWSRAAHAQREPAASEIAAARQEFVVGVEAAREGRWDVALKDFERSYALYPHPQTLFNVASARRQLGKLVSAAEAYRKYLHAPPSDTDPDSRAQAEAALLQIEPALPQIAVHAPGLQPGDELLLDGAALSHSALELTLPVDPGAHLLLVRRDRVELTRREFSVEPKSKLDLTLEVPASQMAATVATPAQAARSAIATRASNQPDMPPREQRPRLVRQWWLWTAVAVVVGGVVTGIVLATDKPNKEVHGNMHPDEVAIP